MNVKVGDSMVFETNKQNKTTGGGVREEEGYNRECIIIMLKSLEENGWSTAHHAMDPLKKAFPKITDKTLSKVTSGMNNGLYWRNILWFRQVDVFVSIRKSYRGFSYYTKRPPKDTDLTKYDSGKPGATRDKHGKILQRVAARGRKIHGSVFGTRLAIHLGEAAATTQKTLF